jgi:DNA invertase Pin-like site-specific DNA recombinase
MRTSSARRVAIYARVSTHDKGQDPENQLLQLRAWCGHAGHELVREHVEHVEHESGAKGERDRKAFAELLAAAARREFDLVLFWSLDRFSREGMAQTVGYLQRLQAHGVDFHSYTEEYLATDNELVRNILLAVMASLAKVEAQRISERTKAGLARAHGKKLGRPAPPCPALPCPALPSEKRAKVERLRRADPNRSIRSIAKEARVSYETARSHLRGL